MMVEKDGERLWIEDTDLAYDFNEQKEMGLIDYFGVGGYEDFWKEGTDDAYRNLVRHCVDTYNKDRQEALESRYGIRSEEEWLESDIPWYEMSKFLEEVDRESDWWKEVEEAYCELCDHLDCEAFYVLRSTDTPEKVLARIEMVDEKSLTISVGDRGEDPYDEKWDARKAYERAVAEEGRYDPEERDNVMLVSYTFSLASGITGELATIDHDKPETFKVLQSKLLHEQRQGQVLK